MSARLRDRRVFHLTHLDGRILVSGLEYRTGHGSAELTRAEVLALVKFAAELWLDQVERIVDDVAATGAEDVDAPIPFRLVEQLSGCDECGSYNPKCGDCRRLHPEAT